jgi:hypothetical protein
MQLAVPEVGRAHGLPTSSLGSNDPAAPRQVIAFPVRSVSAIRKFTLWRTFQEHERSRSTPDPRVNPGEDLRPNGLGRRSPIRSGQALMP